MPKTVASLSEATVRNVRPQEKAYRLFDGGGLFLLVTPAGGKLWRFKYRFEGRENLISFGTYPETSLEAARSQRDAARELLRLRIDPGALRKEEKARKKAQRLESQRTPSVRITFDGTIELWKGGNIMRLTADEARFIARLLDNVTR
jgi:hypothetical protein